MKLSFVLKNNMVYRFIIEGLTISDAIASNSQWEEDITYDNVELYLNNERYNGAWTWAGNNLTAEDIFEQCINAYIRGDKSDYKPFGSEWDVFSPIKKLIEYDDNGLIIKLPVVSGGKVKFYNLDLATPHSKFYSSDDLLFILLDADGGIVTDTEAFYESAMQEDICLIIKGEAECLFKGSGIDRMIESFGGNEGFLREYDKAV